MQAIFGKKRKNKIRIEKEISSPTLIRSRFRGQSRVRSRSMEVYSSNLVEPVRPDASPPTPLRHNNHSGATFKERQNQQTEQRPDNSPSGSRSNLIPSNDPLAKVPIHGNDDRRKQTRHASSPSVMNVEKIQPEVSKKLQGPLEFQLKASKLRASFRKGINKLSIKKKSDDKTVVSENICTTAPSNSVSLELDHGGKSKEPIPGNDDQRMEEHLSAPLDIDVENEHRKIKIQPAEVSKKPQGRLEFQLKAGKLRASFRRGINKLSIKKKSDDKIAASESITIRAPAPGNSASLDLDHEGMSKKLIAGNDGQRMEEHVIVSAPLDIDVENEHGEMKIQPEVPKKTQGRLEFQLKAANFSKGKSKLTSFRKGIDKLSIKRKPYNKKAVSENIRAPVRSNSASLDLDHEGLSKKPISGNDDRRIQEHDSASFDIGIENKHGKKKIRPEVPEKPQELLEFQLKAVNFSKGKSKLTSSFRKGIDKLSIKKKSDNKKAVSENIRAPVPSNSVSLDLDYEGMSKEPISGNDDRRIQEHDSASLGIGIENKHGKKKIRPEVPEKPQGLLEFQLKAVNFSKGKSKLTTSFRKNKKTTFIKPEEISAPANEPVNLKPSDDKITSDETEKKAGKFSWFMVRLKGKQKVKNSKESANTKDVPKDLIPNSGSPTFELATESPPPAGQEIKATTNTSAEVVDENIPESLSNPHPRAKSKSPGREGSKDCDTNTTHSSNSKGHIFGLSNLRKNEEVTKNGRTINRSDNVSKAPSKSDSPTKVPNSNTRLELAILPPKNDSDDENPDLHNPRRPPATPPKPLDFKKKSGGTLKDKLSQQYEKGKRLCKRQRQLFMAYVKDPNHLKPQSFKVGYLYKSEGIYYKTKRHFRLSKEGGLKIYKNEQDKITSPNEEICLDFMRCELQVGVPDIVNKDPRYFFCLKSDDLSAKSWFLAAESEYERKKWMVSLAWHIENHCKPSVTEVNDLTKEYLGYVNSDDQQDEFNTSSSNSDYDSDSDDVYQAGIERSPRIVPQIAERDDEIYGEFDPHLATQYEIKEAAAAVNGMSLHDPRRGSLDRKASTTLNIIPDLDTRKPVNAGIAEEDEDDTYMAAADVGGTSSLSAQISLGGGPAISSQPPVDDDDTYMDGFSLKMSSSTTLEAPALPASRPPSLISSETPFLPAFDAHTLSVDTGESVSIVQPPLYDNPLDAEVFRDVENLYIDHDELASSTIEDDDIYTAPPTLGVDVQQTQTFAPPIPQRVQLTPVPLPPRNLPPRPPS